MVRTPTIPILLLLSLLALTPLLPAMEEEGRKTAGEFFSGEVTKWKARRITLEYDLSSKDSLEDFTFECPFSSPPSGGFKVKGKALDARGTGAFVHVGVFEPDIAVSLTLSSKDPKDVGVLLMEPGVTGKFILFGLADTFLSERDNHPPRQHMITLHGVQSDGDPASGLVFRYFRRSRKPALEKNEPIEVEVRKRGSRNRFTFAGTYMDAEDKYDPPKEYQPALYVLGSEMTVTKLEITGKLTEGWLEEKGIAWDRSEKDDEEVRKIEAPTGDVVPVPDEEDSGRGRGRGRGGPPWGKRGSEAMDHVRTLGDEGADEKDREKAAESLSKENVKLDELRALISCLYSDDLTTRTLALKALKKVTGKTLGYHPKAPEKARKKAIRNWSRYLMENREKFR